MVHAQTKQTDLHSCMIEKDETILSGERLVSYTTLKDQMFTLSKEWIQSLKLLVGSKLLVGRGSGLGPGFIAKGPIYTEALKHKSMLLY